MLGRDSVKLFLVLLILGDPSESVLMIVVQSLSRHSDCGLAIIKFCGLQFVQTYKC